MHFLAVLKVVGFNVNLLMRGLRGEELIISDRHRGFRNALEAIFPSVRWQSCVSVDRQKAELRLRKAGGL